MKTNSTFGVMSNFTFPFIGAGEASYFEWAEMFVCFEQEPTEAQALAIAKRVPLPLRDTIEWKGPLLWVASEQGVGRIIAAAYGKQPAKPKKLTTNSRFKVAPSAAYTRFNADINEWLNEANGESRVLIVYQRDDHEAEGAAVWIPRYPQASALSRPAWNSAALPAAMRK